MDSAALWLLGSRCEVWRRHPPSQVAAEWGSCQAQGDHAVQGVQPLPGDPRPVGPHQVRPAACCRATSLTRFSQRLSHEDAGDLAICRRLGCTKPRNVSDWD